MRARSALLIPLLLTLAVAGCKNSAKPAAVAPASTTAPGASSGPTPTPAATTATSKPLPPPGTDACTVLTPAIATQALGKPAQKKADSGSTANVKRCEYTPGDGSQTFAGLGIVTKPKTAADFQRAMSAGSSCSSISGFGDAAFICDTVRSPSTIQDLYLAVLDGSTMAFISNDPLDPKGNPLPGARARTIALAHLLLG